MGDRDLFDDNSAEGYPWAEDAGDQLWAGGGKAESDRVHSDGEAVMGSKKLKAVAVRGTLGVPIAEPQRMLDLCLHASREGQTPTVGVGEQQWYRKHLERLGLGYRVRKCGFCMTPCVNILFMDVPGDATAGTHTVAHQCWGYGATTMRARNEARAITSDYGFNGWEISFGIIPWLQMCKRHGLIDTIGGVDIPVADKEVNYLRDTTRSSGEFLVALLNKMVNRDDELGDALADGACYAADRLFDGKGKPFLDHIYPRHAGQTAHWVGHWGTGGDVYFPFWLTPILQWCVDTRDPASDSTHQYTEHVLHYLPVHGPQRGPLSFETARAVCAKVYGNADVCDPTLAYDAPETKAIPAIFHHDRGMIIESLVLCDYENTRVFSMESEDNAADTALMAKLFSASTGFETSEGELDLAGERIFNVLRAIDVRNYDRSRRIDDYTAETLTHPAFTDAIELDLEKFGLMQDKYYELRGWNPANGWPTRAKLEELGLDDVAEGLATIGKLGK